MIETTRKDHQWQATMRPHYASDTLHRVPDQALTELLATAEELVDRYHARGDGATGAFVEHALTEAIVLEQQRRAFAREDARVLLEANGHEVTVQRRRDPEGWQPSCSCGEPLALHDGQADAHEDARRHAALTGGRVTEARRV